MIKSRSQKKQAELQSEIEAVSGTSEAHLLYGQKTWGDFSLHSQLLKNLKALKCKRPTIIQEQAVEAAFQGKDVLGAAPTGSGKTLAFCVPVVDWLMKKLEEEEIEEEKEEVEDEEDDDDDVVEKEEVKKEEDEEEDEEVEKEEVEDEEEEGDKEVNDEEEEEENHEEGMMAEDSEEIIEESKEDESERDDHQLKNQTHRSNSSWNIYSIIISPTRELALQTTRVLTRLCTKSSIRYSFYPFFILVLPISLED